MKEKVINLSTHYPNHSDYRKLVIKYDMHMAILFRNMVGGTPAMGDIIREIAQKASLEKRIMQVMEIGEGICLKALSFQEMALRRHGDYLHYGSLGKFDKPEIQSTIVSSRDYLLDFLKNTIAIPKDSYAMQDIPKDYLYSAFKAWDLIPYTLSDKDTILRILRDLYSEKVNKGDIHLFIGQVSNQLSNLIESDKKYDLIFPELSEAENRIEYIEKIQNLLHPWGYAIIPITWWRPNSWDKSKGLSRIMIIDDTINGKNLDEYLVNRYPENFSIAHYPGASALIIKGSRIPVSLPKPIGVKFLHKRTENEYPAFDWKV